ncbi:hypothetical protein P691DRAFT_805415, partial [Macrolepiota fuliginosa MF-IS2]
LNRPERGQSHLTISALVFVPTIGSKVNARPPKNVKVKPEIPERYNGDQDRRAASEVHSLSKGKLPPQNNDKALSLRKRILEETWCWVTLI